jgi:hypothetical protein
MDIVKAQVEAGDVAGVREMADLLLSTASERYDEAMEEGRFREQYGK